MILGTFIEKYFPFTASLALQMLEFYKELWLSGAVTPARCPENPDIEGKEKPP